MNTLFQDLLEELNHLYLKNLIIYLNKNSSYKSINNAHQKYKLLFLLFNNQFHEK